MSGELTKAEKVFALRMANHIESGLTPTDAAKAVIEDDARIIRALFERGASQYFPTPDERGRSIFSGIKIGDVIAAEMSGKVYSCLRSQAYAA